MRMGIGTLSWLGRWCAVADLYNEIHIYSFITSLNITIHPL